MLPRQYGALFGEANHCTKVSLVGFETYVLTVTTFFDRGAAYI